MRENRQSGSEGGGTETNRSSLPLSKTKTPAALYLLGPRPVSRLRQNPCTPAHGSPNAKTNLPLSIHGEGAGG